MAIAPGGTSAITSYVPALRASRRSHNSTFDSDTLSPGLQRHSWAFALFATVIPASEDAAALERPIRGKAGVVFLCANPWLTSR